MIDIKDKHDCCGCTACASICGHHALEMVADAEGFLYPKCDLIKCTNCHLCERVCPIISRDSDNASDRQPLQVLALHNADEKIWQSSSSGGVFAAIAKRCIDRDGIVYGAEYDDNFVVVHRGESTHEGVLKFRGSKYVQSNLCGVYGEIREQLRAGKEVVFSGVPCQVEGLKNFLMKPYDNLTTLDILCHGVPSPLVFADYIRFIRKYTAFKLDRLFMKDKTFGWGYQNLRLYYRGGISEFNTSVSNLWNKIFYDHIANRPSCHKCKFKNFHRAGDLTLGDFWKIEKSHPDFTSAKGISLLLINTPQGGKIWNEIQSEFKYVESNPAECLQPALYHSYPEPSDRTSFWEEYMNHGFDRTIRKKYRISIVELIRRNVTLLKHKLL